MSRPVRRVVTGHLEDGRSTVLIDGAAPNVKQRHAGNASVLLWVTDETPARPSSADRAAREVGVPPPRRGTIFRVAEFPPGVGGEVRDNETVFRDFAIGADVKRGHAPRHPAIHRTRSVATNHAWINRGTAVCRLAMVFVDAEEPEEILG